MLNIQYHNGIVVSMVVLGAGEVQFSTGSTKTQEVERFLVCPVFRRGVVVCPLKTGSGNAGSYSCAFPGCKTTESFLNETIKRAYAF